MRTLTSHVFKNTERFESMVAGEEWERRDKNLVDYTNQRIRWAPDWIHRISLEPFSLNFVLGLSR